MRDEKEEENRLIELGSSFSSIVMERGWSDIGGVQKKEMDWSLMD